jgi:hypothetical protein
MQHARISPSALARVELCPGSIGATEFLPRTSDRAAAEGTLLHEIASDCLEHGLDPDDFVPRTLIVDGHAFDVTSELVGCIYPALDWLREQPGRIFVEKRVALEPWMPGQYGFLDVGLVTPEVCTIFDWKFGFLKVAVAANLQLIAYAIGFYETVLRPLGLKPAIFRLIIEQPRSPGACRFWEPWEISFDDLMAYGPRMAEIMARASDPQAPRVAGEKQCFFCAARSAPGGCDAHSAFLLDLMGQKFEDLDAPAPPVFPASLTPERRSAVVTHAAMIRKWLADLDRSALADALAGRPTPGLKVVAGQKGDRKWSDKERAEALLVAALAGDAFTKKLISPAQGEKILKPRRGKEGTGEAWQALEGLIEQDDGKPILVPESDSRPALTTWEDKFDEDDGS